MDDQFKTRKSLPLSERIKVIQQHKKTPNSRELASMFECSLTQIKNILRRRDEYLEEFQNNGNLARIKRRQSARFLTVGVIICEWLKRCYQKRIRVTDDKILMTGRYVCEKLNMIEVRPSNNWLERMRMKFKMSEAELSKIVGCKIGKSVKIDDIIQDLRYSCTSDSSNSLMTFPYELTRQYIKEIKTGKRSIAKIRMKNCLEEMKSDKYLQVDEISNGMREGMESDENSTTYTRQQEDIKDCKLMEPDYSSDSNFTNNNVPARSSCAGEKGLKLSTICLKEQAFTKGIKSYKEAYNILGPLERFALEEVDIRAVGLINQLENHFRDKFETDKII